MPSLCALLEKQDWSAAFTRIRESRQAAQNGYPIDADFHPTPLHAAIQNGAPTELTMLIFKAYPQAATIECKFSHHKPLFRACAFGAAEEVVEALLLVHPEAMTEPRRFLLQSGTPHQIMVAYPRWSFYSDDRKEVLAMTSRSPEYWKARGARMRNSLTNNGEFEDEIVVEPTKGQLEPEIFVDFSSSPTIEGELARPTVPEVLESLGLHHLEQTLMQDHFIRAYEDLIDLSVEDLKEMGLKIGERNRIKKYIAKAIEPTPKVDSNDPDLVTARYYASLFDSIDDHGQGKIHLDAFAGALQAIGQYKNPAETEAIFQKADINGNGLIDLEEFILLMKYAGHSAPH